MIARESHYLDKSVKKIYDKLDLNSLVNNAYDIYVEFTDYLQKNFENVKTGNKVVVNSYDNGSIQSD